MQFKYLVPCLAILGAAGPGRAETISAAPVAVDVEALKTGQLPAAGTRDEADSCAAETAFMLIALLQTGKLKADDMAKLAEPMALWSKRAAAFRPMDPKAYGSDKAVADATMAMVKIDFDTNVALEKACMQRLLPDGGK